MCVIFIHYTQTDIFQVFILILMITTENEWPIFSILWKGLILKTWCHISSKHVQMVSVSSCDGGHCWTDTHPKDVREIQWEWSAARGSASRTTTYRCLLVKGSTCRPPCAEPVLSRTKHQQRVTWALFSEASSLEINIPESGRGCSSHSWWWRCRGVTPPAVGSLRFLQRGRRPG